MIDKNTQLCCSFSCHAGSVGCRIHNAAFKVCGLNFIYKSFAVDNIEKAIQSMRCLSIRGSGIAMPYKMKVINYLDNVDKCAQEIGVVNTVVNTDGVLCGYNTDYYSVSTFFKDYDKQLTIYVLGNGGMGTTAAFALREMGHNVQMITRSTWSKISTIRESIIVNCTPVKVQVGNNNKYIDTKTDTREGLELSFLQASKQFELYTGQIFPFQNVDQMYMT